MARTRELVDAATERLRTAGSDTPRLDAELLLAFAIGVDRTAVIAHGDAPVGADAEATFQELVGRRETGEPVAYLRGMKEFHGIALTVDRRALIPRPETEELVDRTIAEIMARLTAGARSMPLRVIDVGTGSGAIAVAVAVALRARGVPASDVTIVAADADGEALDLARENAVAHGVGDRLAFEEADLLPQSTTEQWEVVAANLPYVRSEVVDALAAQRASPAFEPRRALDGGPDGLAVIGRLLDQLPDGLAPEGVAMLEIGADQGGSIVALAADRLPSWSCSVMTDLAGLPRIARLQRDERRPT
ncbi:MAG TPA: peptide chain release factor N(5)-glutamine methyltransferase [Candidatus Limnocylindrales bacterium]|jgi:release factor glutamine methyltransferase|nr:peptide chain release factor N(5)-glutamine methyltransferase [Candidatus Limnocylindrales bacterium]